MYKCSKCNKVLTSAYNYERHLNRKIPCNVLLQCIRCDKIFKYQRELDIHANRKFPCKITSDNIIREEREKDRQLQLKLAEQKNKILTDIQDKKNNIAEEKIKIKIIEAAANAERIIIRKEEIASRETLLKLKIQADIDSQLAKTESRLALVQESEHLRLVNKQQTASVINTQNIIINNNFYMDSIKRTCENTTKCFTNNSTFAEDLITTILNGTVAQQKKLFLKAYNSSANTQELIQYIISFLFTNKKYTDARNMFYIKANKTFYGLYIINNEILVKPLDYNLHLRSLLTSNVMCFFDEIVKYITYLPDDVYLMKCTEMTIDKIPDSIKFAAKITLEHEPVEAASETLQIQN